MKHRLFIVLMGLAITGCGRTVEHKAGDLAPYLQMKTGTPVVVHLAATGPDGKIREGVFARGTLYRISMDEVRIRTEEQDESIGYSKELVRRIDVDNVK